MEAIKCNGKCQECQLNGLIDSVENCAITTTQRRTFEIATKLNYIEELVLKLISEKSEEKKIVETFDEIITTKKRKEKEND